MRLYDYAITNILTEITKVTIQYPNQTHIIFHLSIPIPIQLQHIRELILSFPNLYRVSVVNTSAIHTV